MPSFLKPLLHAPLLANADELFERNLAGTLAGILQIFSDCQMKAQKFGNIRRTLPTLPNFPAFSWTGLRKSRMPEMRVLKIGNSENRGSKSASTKLADSSTLSSGIPFVFSSNDQDVRKGGVEFKGDSVHYGFGRFDGVGGSGKHLALLSHVLRNAGQRGGNCDGFDSFGGFGGPPFSEILE